MLSEPTFHYGDRICFLTKPRPARSFRNPGAFDHEGYLADRGIAALGSAKTENVERLSGFSGTRWERLRGRMHLSVIAKVHRLWPARQAALIDAMVIGEEAFIDPAQTPSHCRRSHRVVHGRSVPCEYHSAAHIHPAVMELTALDVGPGDSVLLVTPTATTLLVDAGGPIGPGGSQLDFGEDAVCSYLWERGVSHRDAVAISRGHSDHMGGMAAGLRNFRPKELWIGLLPQVVHWKTSSPPHRRLE